MLKKRCAIVGRPFGLPCRCGRYMYPTLRACPPATKRARSYPPPRLVMIAFVPLCLVHARGNIALPLLQLLLLLLPLLLCCCGCRGRCWRRLPAPSLVDLSLPLSVPACSHGSCRAVVGWLEHHPALGAVLEFTLRLGFARFPSQVGWFAGPLVQLCASSCSPVPTGQASGRCTF